jgi:hypothetical protein
MLPDLDVLEIEREKHESDNIVKTGLLSHVPTSNVAAAGRGNGRQSR